MNTNDKYKNYSAADIRKYLRGDLSAREMQALEAAALEDPFLADALEGMENDRLLRGEGAFREDLDKLKDRLARRLTEKDEIFLTPLYRSVWKVAAAVILLAGLGSITYRYLLNGRSSTPALARAVPENQALLPADSIHADRSKPVITDQEGTDSGKMAATPLQKPETSFRARATPHPAPAAPRLLTFEATRLDTPKDKFKYLSPVIAYKKEFFGKNDNKASGVGNSSADSTNRGGQFLIGKVTDDNNNPIPLITISISGHQQAVRTDNNGLFRVQRLGSDSATHIRIGSSGFESVDVPAYILSDKSTNGGIANTIRLQSQFEGSGYATVNNERLKKNNSDNAGNMTMAPAATQKNIVQQSVPACGWPVYKSYLEKNKMGRSIDSTRKGTEAISFKVSKKGHLSGFRVESSLSPAHDSLLLHLIKQGSAWRPLNGNNSSATVILSY